MKIYLLPFLLVVSVSFGAGEKLKIEIYNKTDDMLKVGIRAPGYEEDESRLKPEQGLDLDSHAISEMTVRGISKSTLETAKYELFIWENYLDMGIYDSNDCAIDPKKKLFFIVTRDQDTYLKVTQVDKS